MNYHFQKCEHLHIGNHDINFEHTMQTNSGEIKVQKVTSEKDLGVTVDQNLKFTDHTNNKVNKANRNVGLIFRTFTFMDKDMFLSIINLLLDPILEYASSVWSPMFKKDKILQRRARRLVKCLKHLSYEDSLKTLGLPSLEYRRERSDMIQVYKIMHGIDKVDKDKVLSNVWSLIKIVQKRSRLLVRTNSFSNRVVDSWNSLTEDVVNAPSLNAFKSWARTPIQIKLILLLTRTTQQR